MKVNVTKENVVITECSRINEGEYRVNKCEFQLPEYFDGLTVTAAFDNIPVPLFGNECYIPSLKKGTSTLGVYAYEETEDGLRLMYSPKPAMFYVDAGSYNNSIGKEEIPETSVFEKYCKEISDNAIPKTYIVENFDIDDEVSAEQIYSAGAVMELAEVVCQEIENDREKMESLSNEYKDFTRKIDDRVSASESKIYAVGNSLKGIKSGYNNLVIADISSVEHSLNINLSCDSISDYSATSIIVHGKNMFGFEGRTVKNFGDTSGIAQRSFTGDGIYVGVSGSNYYSPGKVAYTHDSLKEEIIVDCQSAWYGVGVDIAVKPGETYAVSMDTEQQNARMVVAFYNDQGTYLSVVQVTGNKITIPDKAYWMLCVLCSSQVASGVKFRNVQIEKGIEPTDFCKYAHPEKFTADREGRISNAESIYPVTIIEADNPEMTITAEYNRDINVAFNELRDAIVRLGGSV